MKKKIFFWVKLCFSLYFIPLDPDPDPRTQMNPDPTGSGSTSLQLSLGFQIYFLSNITINSMNKKAKEETISMSKLTES